METSPSPSVDQFAEVLSQESKWFNFGIFLGTPTVDLKKIEHNYGSDLMRCLIELYSYFESKGEPLSWEIIATALRRMGNNSLADKIHSNYILPFIRRISSVSSKEEEEEEHPVAIDRPPSDSHVKASDHIAFQIKDSRVEEVGREFQSLTERFVVLTSKIKRSFKVSTVDTEELQDLIEGFCGLAPLPQGQATFEAVFKRLKQHCSILNFRVLVLLVENLLSNEEILRKELARFTTSVESFKKSAKMIELVSLIQANQQAVSDGNHEKVELKVRDFWIHFTMKQFEVVMNEILYTLYNRMSHITVGKGCICVSWVIPDHVNASKLVPELSIEFVQIIGVISLHIGDTVIYDIGEGCETIEAAMLQAIELKNTQAIELLLAVGCSLEVATYNEDNAVTAIVNIREKSCDSSGSSVMCILGHNEHVEAIVDSSRDPGCSSCRVKEKMMKHFQQEIDILRQQANFEQKVDEVSDVLQRKQDSYVWMKLIEDSPQRQKSEELSIAKNNPPKMKQDAEKTLLKKENQALIKELNLKGVLIETLTEQLKTKDAENTLLKRENQTLIKEMNHQDVEVSLSDCANEHLETTAVETKYTLVRRKQVPTTEKDLKGVAPDLTDLVGKATVNITRDEAIHFGAELGLTYADMQDVIYETGIAREPYVALALYKEAERRQTFVDHSFVRRVTKALERTSSLFDNK